MIEAAKSGNTNALLSSLVTGTDPNSLDMFGFSPLQYSAMYGRDDAVRLLVEHGANVNFLNDLHTRTILMDATMSCNTATIELLVNHGANIRTKNRENDTALSIAARRGHKMIARVLLESGAELRVYDAALLGYFDELRRLISEGSNINERVCALTPVHAAAVYKQMESVSLLLQLGASVFDLHEATAIGDVGIIRKMIRKGANVNGTIDGGATPLMIAASLNNVSAIRALIDCGADIDLESDAGYTAVRWAQVRGSTDAFEVLSQRGRTCLQSI